MAASETAGKTKEEATIEDKELQIPEVRAHFSSKQAIILSCLGTVIGTGNIWRFPRIVANNSEDEGGLVFLLVWALFLFLWSIPVLLLEYGTGRFTQCGVIASVRQLTSDRLAWCGAFVCMVTFFISSFYSVVLGWCFYYFVYSCAHSLPETAEESRQIFKDFAEDSLWPTLTHAVAVILAGLAVSKGVKTIEKVSIVLVPLFLVILLFTFVWSLTRAFAGNGIVFLFTPKWESFGKPRLWVDALSQNAFDTGAGMGLMIPYASFMTRNNGIVRYGSLIPAANNLVSLIAGITIFGTVFSTLITSQPFMTRTQIVDIFKDSGPASTGLTFIWIPVLFQTVGTFGRVLCILFFLCLSFAGLTSLISNIEQATLTLDDFGLSRKFSMPIIVVLMYLMGLMSALNINILTNQDFVWGFALVLTGLTLQAVVIRYGVTTFRAIVVNDFGIDDWKLPKVWEYAIKFVAPVEAVLLIIWWSIDVISNETQSGLKWYEFGRETFMVTIVQWLGLLAVLVAGNLLVAWLLSRRRATGERVVLLSSAAVPDTDCSTTTSHRALEICL